MVGPEVPHRAPLLTFSRWYVLLATVMDKQPGVSDASAPECLSPCPVQGCATELQADDQFSLGLHLSLAHPDVYEQRFPRQRGRGQRRRRFPHIFVSQARELYPAKLEVFQASGLVYDNPAFMIPGGAVLQGIDPCTPERYSTGPNIYTCPISGCSKVYRASCGLVYHLTRACCDPPADVIDGLLRKWSKEERNLLADEIPLVMPDPPLVEDAPLLTAYKWPQTDSGTWVILHPWLEQFTGWDHMEQQHVGSFRSS